MEDNEQSGCDCKEELEEQTCECVEQQEVENNEEIEEQTCECSTECECGEGCKCTENEKCNSNCSCGEGKECTCDNDCECGEDCGCDHECRCEENKSYLNDMLRIQAEFDNYRKRMAYAIGDARNDGFIDAIEQFLPALDSFKMATDMITDKNTLMGIKFIEKGILDTLSKMGVEEIDTTGKFNPELHQAIDTEENDDFESGDIIKVASKGFKYKGKVIRYSQVIVKK